MGEKQEKKKAVCEHLATVRQVELVLDLYEETGYKKRFPSGVLDEMPQREIQSHIDFLIGYKRNGQSQGAADKRVNGFNDAAFGMVYKMFLKARMGVPPAQRIGDASFAKLVYDEFLLYKVVRDYAKKRVAEAGD